MSPVGDVLTPEMLLTVGGIAAVVAVVFQFILKPLWKPTPDLLDRVGPTVAIVMGIVFALIATFILNLVSGRDIFAAVMTGVYGGLASIGLYSAVKSVT